MIDADTNELAAVEGGDCYSMNLTIKLGYVQFGAVLRIGDCSF